MRPGEDDKGDSSLEASAAEILVVEDSPTQALKLAHVLGEAGYRVSVANNGEEALAYLADHLPALIISDVMMPKMDGYQMCQRVKSAKATRHIPVLLLTSLTDVHDLLRSLEAGADAFASKPYHEEKLLVRVQNILLNQERWRTAIPGAEKTVSFAGQDHPVTVAARDILESLLYTYEDAVDKNLDLIKVRDELARSNTELQQTATELAASNRDLESFSASVSHDLRNPLQLILGYAEMLLLDGASRIDDQGKQNLRQLFAAAKHMNQLIDDLLRLSRTTRTEMKRTSVSLSGLVQGIADELRMTDSSRTVELVIAQNVRADGDEALLKIVLINLLNNAWKFTGKQPHARIEFGVAEMNGKPAYYVRDNGVGFEMRDADSLFTAFHRLHSNDEFPGTGIGLVTVQRIVQRHGGQIRAEGKVGEGAVFTFTLG